MTELEQRLLEAVERMEVEQRQREADLRQTMQSLTERVNVLAAQVEDLTSLLQRVVQP